MSHRIPLAPLLGPLLLVVAGSVPTPAAAPENPEAGGGPGYERVYRTQFLRGQDGPLVFDRGAGALARGTEEIHLTNTEFRLLSVLAENAGRVLSRSSLLEHVWDRGFFGDERIVDVHVRRLRKKLETDPSSPAILVTVRGLGYRLDVR